MKVVLSATLGLACLASSSPPVDSTLELKTRGVLRVLVQSDGLREVYAWDRPEGIEYEMLRGFAALHDLKIETVPVPLMIDRIPWLLDDRGDMLAGGVVVTDARKRQIAFASETFPIRHVVLTKKPHTPVRTVEELRLLKVGTIPGTSWAEVVKEVAIPKANVDDRYQSTDQLTQALLSGEVRAAVMSVIWAMVERRKHPELELGLMLGAPTSISFAVRYNQPKLLAALDAYVVATRRTPTWSRLVVKYFGEEALDVLRRSRE